uniref:Secreted protein n=1 Tax=Parascaris univalens TaxID=6257 RepID=A0A915B4L4_PARUN
MTMFFLRLLLSVYSLLPPLKRTNYKCQPYRVLRPPPLDEIIEIFGQGTADHTYILHRLAPNVFYVVTCQTRRPAVMNYGKRVLRDVTLVLRFYSLFHLIYLIEYRLRNRYFHQEPKRNT